MANFFVKKAKLIFFIYTLVLASIFILGCTFMTNYKDIMVNYSIDSQTGEVQIIAATEGVVGTGKNQNLFDKFATGVFTPEYVEKDKVRLDKLISNKYSEINTAQAKIDTAEFTTIPKLGAELALYVESTMYTELVPLTYYELSYDSTNELYTVEYVDREIERNAYAFETNSDGSYVTNAYYQTFVDDLAEKKANLDAGLSEEQQKAINEMESVLNAATAYYNYLDAKIDEIGKELRDVANDRQNAINSGGASEDTIAEYEDKIVELQEQLIVHQVLFNGNKLSFNGYDANSNTDGKLQIDANDNGIFNEAAIDLDGDGIFGEIDANGDGEINYGTIELDTKIIDGEEVTYVRVVNREIESELYAQGTIDTSFVVQKRTEYNTAKAPFDSIRQPWVEARDALSEVDNVLKNYTTKIQAQEKEVLLQQSTIALKADEIDFVINDKEKVKVFDKVFDLGDQLLIPEYDENGNPLKDDKGNVIYDKELSYAYQIYNYRLELNSYNNLIFTFGMVSMVALVLLYVFANNSRRIYYKSNLYAGIVFPLVPIIFGIVMIVKDMQLMSTFNDNYDLFNFVSVMQNNVLSGSAYDWSLPTIMENYSCSSLTFILTLVLIIIIIAYSLFIVIYSIMRYKSCAKERAEIIERAVANND